MSHAHLVWLIVSLLAVLGDCAATWYLISHHVEDADDNPLIGILARKWGYRTALLLSFVVRAAGIGAAATLGQWDAIGFISVPALILLIVNVGNHQLDRRN